MEFDNSSRTEISQLGEFGLIRHLTQHFAASNPATVKGVGDDGAVIRSGGADTVVTTDMLVEGIHFDMTYVPLKHLGYKSVAVNVSDICAMNATPAQILVSIAISSRFSLEAVEELYAGIKAACEHYKVDLIGGDTTTSRMGLVISITAIGNVSKDGAVYRSGAKEKDLLCVSGDLGAAYMGLQLLEREKSVFRENPNLQPDFDGKDYILSRQLKPEARTDVVQALHDAGITPTAMIDISDGLSSEILHICTQSGVGVELYEDKIPLDPMTSETAFEFNMDPTVCALNGGEDYELLFTIPLADYEKIKKMRDVTVIGHITEKSKGTLLVTRDGAVHELKAQGWNPLASG